MKKILRVILGVAVVLVGSAVFAAVVGFLFYTKDFTVPTSLSGRAFRYLLCEIEQMPSSEERNTKIQQALDTFRLPGEWEPNEGSLGSLCGLVIYADNLQEPVAGAELLLTISTDSAVLKELTKYFPCVRRLGRNRMSVRLHDLANCVVNRRPSRLSYFLYKMGVHDSEAVQGRKRSVTRPAVNSMVKDTHMSFQDLAPSGFSALTLSETKSPRPMHEAEFDWLRSGKQGFLRSCFGGQTYD